MYEDILLVLRDGWGEGKFKFWAQKNFVLVKIGDANVIYNKGKASRPIITYEELYVKLDECHKRVGHHGRDKTWSEIKSQYSWIPYDVVIKFIKLCDACSNRQIFTKFPASKCNKVMFLQSDNGKEFVAKVIKDLKNTWVDLVIINGRARHPETQGLIERGNQTLEVALAKWLQCNQSTEWSKGLGPVTHAINTSTNHTTKKTPYEVVFGQLLRSDFEMWKKLCEAGVEDEENLPVDFVQSLNQAAQSVNSPITTGVTQTDSCSISTAASSALNSIVATVCCESIHSHSDSDSYGTVEGVCFVINENGTQVPDTDIDDNRHKRIRAAAEADYMKAIAKRQKICDEAMKQEQYQKGDLVGLKIDRVDRTNTTPKILPCKVVSVRSSSNNDLLYQLCTLRGVLSISYGVQDLLDLTKCDFADLRAVEPTTLPTMTFIQACKEYISVGALNLAEACNCSGKCATKACPCKIKGVKCCTKCHSRKKDSCINAILSLT
ncbi:unnamed protein product [Adineta ricciae]|uniref:Integrase catalytic domain-containing protein n=1 Tax=Adineta ricciae TaxID=249248 RepID=A0A814UTX1_ADIRI|nr:unnamed protein product [Adineta ricciae]CAF1619098.1 unnamed protein product [Adineta ricciae]